MVNLDEIIVEIISVTLMIYLGVLVGFLFVRIHPLEKYRSQFTWVIINLFTPIIIIIAILSIRISDNWMFPVLGAIMITALGIVAPRVIAKLTHQEKPSPAEICTATFPNAVNFPFPIIFAFSGDTGLGIASLFLGVTVIFRNSLGFWISGYKMTKQSILQIIKFPPNWGIFIGGVLLAFTETAKFDPITEHWFTKIFFQVGIFGTLMTVGFAMKRPSWKFKHPIMRVGITRFLLSGIIVLPILIVFSPPAFVAIAFIIQMTAPPAVYNGIYAEKFGLDTELTSQVIVALTLIALIFLPFEIILLQIYY